jgi:hypothetical protein
MKGLLKIPLLVAAIVVVARVITERLGASNLINSLLSGVALHFLIVPLYFAIRIAMSGEPRPYSTLFKLVALYVVIVRAMLIPVYWLARIFEWPELRFGGLWGPDSSPFIGFVAIPFGTAAFWILASIVFGGGVGSLVLVIMRSLSKRPAIN